MARYWLATYDDQSWEIFLDGNLNRVGQRHERTDITVGDVFLAYVRSTGGNPGEWVSAERVVGEASYDPRRIYPLGIWPYRWPVEPLVPRRRFGDGIVGRDLVGRMRLFDRVRPQQWGLMLRTSGREIPRADGELLVRLLGKPPRRAQ